MTDNSNKVRALILSALMVFSVFAGTVAFAGTAAAATANASASDVTADSNTDRVDYTIESTTALDADGNSGNITIDVSALADAGVDLSDASASIESDSSGELSNAVFYTENNSIVVDVTETTEESGTDATLAEDKTVRLSGIDASGVSDTTATTSVTVNDNSAETSTSTDVDVYVDTVSAVVNSAAAFPNDDRDQDSAIVTTTAEVGDDPVQEDTIVEVSFDQTVITSTLELQDFVVNVDGSEVEPAGIVDPDTDDGQAYLVVDEGSAVEVGEINVTTDADFTDMNGNPVDTSAVDNVTASTASTAIDAVDTDGQEYTAYTGEDVAVVAGTEDADLEIETSEGEFIFDGSTGTESRIYNFGTSDRNQSATYQFTVSSNTDSLDLRNLGLSASVDDTEITTEDALSGTIDANSGNREVDVVLYDSDDDEVDNTTVSLDGSGEGTFDFGSQDAGNYSVEATDQNTGVMTTTDTVTVSEAAEGNVEFTDNTYSVAQGGIANITLDVSGTTEGSLVIGQDDQSGYQANVTFVDEDEDGEVTIRFNSYTAGDTGADIVSAAGDDDTATLASGSTDLAAGDLLAEGGYDLAAVQSHYTDGSKVFENGDASFSSLSITERSTDEMVLWTAPSSTGADALLDSVTQDSTIAEGDWVVHQVSATGLEGLVANEGGFESALNGDALDVTVIQTDETTQQNREAKSLDVTDALANDELALIADAANDTYYIALDTSTDEFERVNTGTDDLTANADEDYTANFTVADSKLVGDDSESVMATFEVVEAAASVDSDPVEVEAATNQSITGTSTLAPGTEVQVTVQSTGDTSPRFYNNPTATVQDDGTWNITMDFDEQSTNDTFSVSAGNYFDVDGTVVEEIDDDTATPEPTETATATPEPDTETATPEPTETDAPDETDEPTETPEDDTTTTTTPGFGVAVALVALLAAALLAGRRE